MKTVRKSFMRYFINNIIKNIYYWDYHFDIDFYNFKQDTLLPNREEFEVVFKLYYFKNETKLFKKNDAVKVLTPYIELSITPTQVKTINGVKNVYRLKQYSYELLIDKTDNTRTLLSKSNYPYEELFDDNLIKFLDNFIKRLKNDKSFDFIKNPSKNIRHIKYFWY